MIEIFIKNLPPQLASQIREQHDSFIPVFKSYADSNNKYYFQLNRNYELSYFMLGLAIFYKSVVIPLREGSSAFRDFHAENITGVQLGKYTFSNNDRWQIQVMYKNLQGILQKHKIPESMLLFSDIKEFARNLNAYLDNSHD